MESIWLYRYSVIVAVVTLFLVVAGASVTSNDAGLSVPDWPLSFGKVMPAMTGGVFYEHGHRMIATTVGFLTVILAVWLWRAERRRWLRRLGFAAVGAVIAQGTLGGLTVLFLLPKPVSIGHACLAQLFFSTTVAIALFTSPSWKSGARAAPERNSMPMRWLALACPVAVLGQIALGAAFRHQALGLIPHVAGAMVASGVVLSTGVLTLLRYGGRPALRNASLALMLLLFVQIFLGVAAYMSLVATADRMRPQPVMVWFTVLHVAVGALTMAASVVLAIQVFRQIIPGPALDTSSVTVTA